MRLDELIRVSLFVTAVGLVYVLAGAMLFKAFLRRVRGEDGPASAVSRRYRWTVLALAAIGIVCIAYGRFVEPVWPEVTHVEITSRKLPAGIRPIRIVLISDVHSQGTPRLEPRLPALIAEQKPDLIFFAGDSANEPAGVPVFRKLMRDLSAIAPSYAVKGNWDTHKQWGDGLFPVTGIHELAGKAEKVSVRGVDLWIAGAPYDRPDSIKPMLDAVPPGAFTILLYHSPDMIESLDPGKVGLYCAGHTHGGQVALPFYGALITFSQFGKKYEAGLYRVSHTWLYVNRGIGMEGGPVPRVRFCARPEITVIDIRGSG